MREGATESEAKATWLHKMASPTNFPFIFFPFLVCLKEFPSALI